MSPDQFRRYRQSGSYGAYRVVFRRISGLTTDDGWTLDTTGLALANLVNDSLPRKVRLKQDFFERQIKWGHWSDSSEARYWVEHGWPAASAEVGGLLPTPDEAIGKPLPLEERRLLEAVLFSAQSIRRATVDILAGAKGAQSHADLCDALAGSSLLAKMLAPASLAPLPSFSRFADAAMHAMRGLWHEINNDDAQQAPAVSKLARSPDLKSRLDRVRGAGAVWLGVAGRSIFPHDFVVTRLAETMHHAATPLDQLRALAQHHQQHGGGRRWFREQAGKLVPLVADTRISASDYRFRLRPLARLAAQCGVTKMNGALDALESFEDDDEEGDSL